MFDVVRCCSLFLHPLLVHHLKHVVVSTAGGEALKLVMLLSVGSGIIGQ